jgi:hypothetical protein
MKINWLPFQEAKIFVHKLNFKTGAEWQKYCKSKKLPSNIPSHPERIYKDKGWIGFGDWLGSGKLPNGKNFCSFKDAREFAQSLGLKSKTGWEKYCKSGDKPDKIPRSPEKTYKKEWKGVGDFLGTGNVKPSDKQFCSFESAREFAQSLGLKNLVEWKRYCKSGDKPSDIPSNPYNIYKKQGTWITWGDFLGTNRISVKIKFDSFLSAKEAKPVLKKLFKEHGIKNSLDWKKFAKTHGKLLDELHLPSDVLSIYSKERFEKREKQ